MKKSFLLPLFLFLPTLCFGQFEDLAQLGLKGPVKSSMEQFNDGRYANIFRLFEPDGKVQGIRVNQKKGEKTWDIYMNAFIYGDDGKLQMKHTTKNEKPVKVEEYSHQGDSLLVNIITETKERSETRYFDSKNRRYYWITPKITSVMQLDENYLPKHYKKITSLGDMESNHQVTVLKTDKYGNWLEAKITYNVLSTKVMKKVTWKRDLEYFD